jgi:hypothetical protein
MWMSTIKGFNLRLLSLRGRPLKKLFKRAFLKATVLILLLLLPPQICRGDGLYIDPEGDALEASPKQGAIPIDITSISVMTDATKVFVDMIFNTKTPIVAPSNKEPNSLSGVIEFDTDRTQISQHRSINDVLRKYINHPLSSIDAEYVLDLQSETEHPGFVNLLNGFNIVASIPITYSSYSLRLSFNRNLFPTTTSVVDFAAIIGNSKVPTDAAPASFGTSLAVLNGDLNGDGKVNVQDATVSLSISVGLITPTDPQIILGDINGDGKLNVQDTTLILKKVVGLL